MKLVNSQESQMFWHASGGKATDVVNNFDFLFWGRTLPQTHFST